MSNPRHCPECGKELPPSAPHGLCAACLLKRGLEANTLAPSEIENQKSKIENRNWSPPSLAELAPRFPELEILRLIGRGGMGAVYLARQKNLDRMVALKILPPDLVVPTPSSASRASAAGAFAQRFTIEAQALARLNHPHIVAIYEFGQRDGLYFLLMEFVDGMNLRGLLDAGHIAPKEALAIVPQICEALQFAHDHGIVHRDIKPKNILLSKTGQVKIADFGLAKLVGARATGVPPVFPPASPSSPPLTTDPWPLTTAAGTPHYMAPEQTTRPAEVDHRADIYSLGVVFYQMLTGQLPPNPLTPPSTKVQIDVRLDEIVLKALEREPEKRYQQVSEVKTQVETILTTPIAPGAPHGNAVVDPQNRTRSVSEGQPPSQIPNLKSEISPPPRLSRLAIVAAIFPPLWFLPYGGPLTYILPTLLGFLAIGRIRRSNGRIYGLALALVEILLLPCILLCKAFWQGFPSLNPQPAQSLTILSVLILLPLLTYIAWRILRTRNRTRSVSEGQPPIPPESPALDQARQTLHIPAIGLRFAAAINLLPLLLLAFVYTVARITEIPSPEPHTHTSISGPAVLFVFIDALFALYILRGTSDMLRLRRYPRTIAASILALLAFPGNLLGLPFGIWSLILLSRREIKDAFAANKTPKAPHGNAEAVPAAAKSAPPANQHATLSIIALILSLLGILAELSFFLIPLLKLSPAYATLTLPLSVIAFITLIAALLLGTIAHRRWPARIALILALTAILWPLLHLRTIRIPVPISPSSAATRPAPVRTALVRTGDLPIYLTAAGSIVSSNKAPAPAVTRPNRNPFMVFFTLPEGDQTTSVIKQTLAGQHLPVDVFDRYFQKKIAEGSLDDIDNQFDTATATLGCRAHATPLEDQLLLRGQNVNVRLLLDTLKNVTFIPTAAIQRDPSSTYTWVVKPSKTDQEKIVERRNITTGETNAGITEIISGLSSGETVVTDGVDNLHNGDKVKPAPSHVIPTLPAFGPVIELSPRMLAGPMDKNALSECFINFRLGQLVPMPKNLVAMENLDDPQVTQWVHQQIHACCSAGEPRLTSVGIGGFLATPTDNDTWQKITPKELHDKLDILENAPDADDGDEMNPHDHFPATFLFRTRDGNDGILQILGYANARTRLKIQFKLVQQPPIPTPSIENRKLKIENPLAPAATHPKP